MTFQNHDGTDWDPLETELSTAGNMIDIGWNMVSYSTSSPVSIQVWKGFSTYVSVTLTRHSYEDGDSMSFGCTITRGIDDKNIIEPFQGLIYSWYKHDSV